MAESDDDAIITEARKRFHAAEDWEAPCRALQDQDEMFVEADSDNNWQWPEALWRDRAIDRGLPCLTVNKTRQHCLQIVNDARQNKAGIEVRPVGDGATFDASQVIEGIVRHIEYISNAQQAYDKGSWDQVRVGIGYWRVITDYVDENSFDQDIRIQRVPNRKSVYLDPDIKEYDGSDAHWGFVFDDIPRDQAIAQGLIDKNDTPSPAFGSGDAAGVGWLTTEHVRVAEYFRRTDKKDELLELPPEIAQHLGRPTVRLSELPPELRKAVPKDVRRRPITTPEIEWFKIVGNEIRERKVWPGKYIPIVRVIGEETVINGILDRKGHTRALKDAQRMYNYNTSASVQYGALQSTAPWLVAADAIENQNDYWKRANDGTLPYLVYNDKDEAGNPVQKPERIAPPMAAPVFLEGLKVAESEMMLASGQYQAVMGAQSNETSGKAINARQRQGDNATYHYIDHLATAIRHTGKIIIDLIPHIYDTKRIIQIVAKDGSRQSVQIDPNAPQAHAATPAAQDGDADNEAITAVLNPTIGLYDVMADVGPSYATQRQEAFNAFSQLITANKEAFVLLGDLWMANADFPQAGEAEERLRNMVPSQAKGGPPPEMQALQAHVSQVATQAQQHIQDLTQQLAEAKQDATAAQQKLADKSGSSALDTYKAETDRIKAIGAIDPEVLKPFFRGMASAELGTAIVPIMAAHAAADQAMAPPPPTPGQQAAPAAQ